MAGGVTGDNQRRFLSTDDQLALRASPAYSSISTTPKHRWSTNGTSWSSASSSLVFGAVIGPEKGCELGAGRLYARTAATTTSIKTYFYDPDPDFGGLFYNMTHSSTSHRPPALACDGSETAIAVWIDTSDNQYIRWRRTTDGGSSWSSESSTGYATGISPAIAYVSWKDWYLLAFSDRYSGKIRVLVSKDDGATFGSYQTFDTLRTASSLGLFCDSSASKCTLSFADGAVSGTPLRAVEFKIDGSDAFYVHTNTNLGYASYGGSVAVSSGRTYFTWRDRGTATVRTNGDWASPTTLSNLTYDTSTYTHSAGDLFMATQFWTNYAAHANYDQ